MTIKNIDHAFILAAGKGTRLRPYTDHNPKPMVLIQGKPIIEHTLHKLADQHVQQITINLFYLGDRIINHLSNWTKSKITFSPEDALLDTGGGVKLALKSMNDKPFYIINGDAFWLDKQGEYTALEQLSRAWNPAIMDILLLLQPVADMTLTQGKGDYNLDKAGKAIRTPNKDGEFMFTGIRITKPEVFNGTPNDAFSFLQCMDKAQEQGRLYGVHYKGDWHHISTPEDLEAVNAALDSININKQAS